MTTRNRTVLSFDLDGTLVQHDFTTAVWREAIPTLIARQRGMDLEEARTWVYGEYDSVGEGSLKWYDLAYWYGRFELDEDWRETLQQNKHLISLFPEVREALESLRGDYRMIILSNASHPFIEAEMGETDLDGLFEAVVSATSDLGEVKKSESFYRRVCDMLNLDPREIIHIGDHWEFDYLAPTSAGIESYYLDRHGKRNGPQVFPDLQSFCRHIQSPATR